VGRAPEGLFNGPTGPNLKDQWTQPIEWADGWRGRSYAVPGGGLFGTSATDFFCVAVERGSRGLVQLLRSPIAVLVTGLLLLALAIFVVTRTTWSPVAPLRVARRRSWGQILRASARMYIRHARLFLGLGILFVPLGMIISLVQAAVLGGFGLLGVSASGESAGALLLLLTALGATFALFGLALLQGATSCALVRVDAGEPIGPLVAYRMTLKKGRALFVSVSMTVFSVVALVATGLLIPVAAWLAVRWSFLAQAIILEDTPAVRSLRRSGRLVHRRWLRVASLVGFGALLALVAGPLIGALLILVTDAPLALMNIFAGIVYALAMPFVALVTTYLYFDTRVREQLEPRVAETLPEEIDLTLPLPNQ
jgi:hypothetical protein